MLMENELHMLDLLFDPRPSIEAIERFDPSMTFQISIISTLKVSTVLWCPNDAFAVIYPLIYPHGGVRCVYPVSDSSFVSLARRPALSVPL